MTKIFTKTGDNGTTALGGNIRVAKTDIRIEANGCLDELNALLGYTKTQAPQHIAQILGDIQSNLMEIMAAVAGKEIDTTRLVNETSAYEEIISSKPSHFSFEIPGSSVMNALLHLLRTKARTCERRLWQANDIAELPQPILIYMNRLSDYMFYLSLNV